MSSLARISVIIPVFNNADALRECLNCLRAQSIGTKNFEIVVVDNGSTDDLGKIRTEFTDVVWLHEGDPSSYAARNCGLKAASSAFIAFTDSDCLPDPQWLQAGLAKLKGGTADIFGGEIRYLSTTGRPLNVNELLEEKLFGMGNHRKLIEQSGFAVTANLFTSKKVFERAGLFDQRLKSSGDREWVRRAVAQGCSVRFAPNALICHPRRATLRAICKKQRRIVGGRTVLLKRGGVRWSSIFFQLYSQSVFDLRMYSYALTSPEVPGHASRIKLLLATAIVQAVTTSERIRILAGGEPQRS